MNKQLPKEYINFLCMLSLVKDRKWRITQKYKHIRDENNRCPLCALVHELNSNFKSLDNGSTASEILGIKDYLSYFIMSAADRHDSLGREAMMDVLGL